MGPQCDSDYAEFRGNEIVPRFVLSDKIPGNFSSVTFDLLVASGAHVLEGLGPSDVMVVTRASCRSFLRESAENLRANKIVTHGGDGSKIQGYQQCLTTHFNIVAFAFQYGPTP